MSWSGVKKQINKAEIEAWCEEMDIKNYTINSKGEIDVDGSVDLSRKDFEKLPYKFGIIKGYFDIGGNQNLKSLTNCPNSVGNYFSYSSCKELDSLEGCPKKVDGDFYCGNCKRKFTRKQVSSLCEVKGKIGI